jgi:hypothetical protein
MSSKQSARRSQASRDSRAVKVSAKEAQRVKAALADRLAAKPDPLVPVHLKSGALLYGTKDAALEFLPDGRVRVIRGSLSLKRDWRSQTKGLRALNDPRKRDGAVVEPILDPIVFDLATFSANREPPPSLLLALEQLLSASDKDAPRLLRDHCVRINAARRIRQTTPYHQVFVAALKELACKLGRPPIKSELVAELEEKNVKLDKGEFSRLLHQTGFGWLASAKPGPKPRIRKVS